MPCSFKPILDGLTHEKAAGPSPSFTVFDLFVAVEIVGTKPVGRNKLAEELEVGGGVVRTILRRLEDAELVETSRVGCLLTEKGANLWRECSTVLRKKRIAGSELTPGEHTFAVLVEGAGGRVGSGIEQRDAAIRLGARSLTTMIFRDNQLVIPSVSEDVARDFPEAAKQIVTLLKPGEKDAIVISSAEERKRAEYGALAAAWTLLD